MKTTPPFLSLLLLITSLALALVSILLAPGFPGIAAVYLSTLGLLARAVVEWSRPRGGSMHGIVWGVFIMVAYAFILPAWAKFYHVHATSWPLVPLGHLLAAGLNLGLPLIKAFMGTRSRA